MSTRKKPSPLLAILLAFGLISIGGYVIFKIQSHRKQVVVDSLIHELEEYRSLNGRYPRDLSKTFAREVDWIYYVPDSMGVSYYLSYTAGVMNCNTFDYTSQRKKWEEHFNY
jgi:type II secretory pathway pseudopilin PulG